MFFPRIIQGCESFQQTFLYTGFQCVAVCFAETLKNFQQFLAGVIGKIEILAEPGGKSGVGINEFVHQSVISGYDDNQFITVILHRFQNRLNGFFAIAVLLAVVGEGIGLIDKQHTAQRMLNDLLRLMAVCPTYPATSALRSASTS